MKNSERQGQRLHFREPSQRGCRGALHTGLFTGQALPKSTAKRLLNQHAGSYYSAHTLGKKSFGVTTTSRATDPSYVWTKSMHHEWGPWDEVARAAYGLP